MTCNFALIRKAVDSLFTLAILCAVVPVSADPAFAPPNLYAPGSTIQLFASCVGWPGGQPYYPCYLTLTSLSWNTDANGHTASQHSSPFPSSAFTITSNGPWVHSTSLTLNAPQMNVWLKAGERGNYPSPATDIRRMVGHDEYLQACAQVCSGWNFTVGWPDLYWVEEKPQWIHVGATAQHMNSNSYNHWMMTVPAYGILGTAIYYLDRHPEQEKIAVNDMGLPFGGLFDISGGWEPSHWEHNRGKSVDVRVGSATYGIPNALADEFVSYCVNVGHAFYGQVETNPVHIHCQWQ